MILDWKVDKTNNFSDHNNITFNLCSEQITLEKTRPWKKANWTEFQQELNSKEIKIREIVTEKRLESLLKTFYTNIDKCLDKACPKEVQKSVDKNNPWWTP